MKNRNKLRLEGAEAHAKKHVAQWTSPAKAAVRLAFSAGFNSGFNESDSLLKEINLNLHKALAAKEGFDRLLIEKSIKQIEEFLND